MSKKTVEKIIASGNEYVIQVKRNQKTLFNEIERVMVEQSPLDVFQIEEKGHGRHSFWSVSIFSAFHSSKCQEWKGLKRFIHVHKEVFYTNPHTKKRFTDNDRLYISSLLSSDAEHFHNGVKNHWSIENKLHWVKDVIHNEDNNRMNTKNGPINNSIISTIAINIHRKNGNPSITDSQIKFGADIKELFNIYSKT